MTETTLAIIKPEAVRNGLVGDILKRIQQAGLATRALKLVRLTRAQAGTFYEVHRERPFYGSLCDYMSSGPIVVAALVGEGAVARWRELMGATDPTKAAPNTIRRDFGTNIEQNAVHGSDSTANAAREAAFFFSVLDLAD